MRKWIPINAPIIRDEEIHAVISVLRSGRLTDRAGSGFFVSQFERKFAKFIGTKYAVAMNSGTAALHASLMCLKLRPLDRVIVPTFTFVSAAEMIVAAMGRPVFADINPETYCIDADNLEPLIDDRTRAIIPTHLYGLTCDMDPIMKLARKYDLAVIEDVAQAHGAVYKGKKAGSIGDFGCFSFYATKCMTTGEGGMVTTNNREYADILRAIRIHGETRDYRSTMLGHNYRMGEIEAAIGLTQLSRLPEFLQARRKNAEILMDKLKDIENLQLPITPSGCEHSFYVFTVRLKGATVGRRNKVVNRLRMRKIEAVVYYPVPIHLMPFYKQNFPCEKGALRESEAAAKQVFSLPVHPGLSEEDVNYVADSVKKVLKR